jgi:hypothetical protein
MGLLGSDPVNHPRVVIKVKFNHYKDIIVRSKHWAIS